MNILTTGLGKVGKSVKYVLLLVWVRLPHQQSVLSQLWNVNGSTAGLFPPDALDHPKQPRTVLDRPYRIEPVLIKNNKAVIVTPFRPLDLPNPEIFQMVVFITTTPELMRNQSPPKSR